MPRVNVWVPDALQDEIRAQLPGLNLSAALQEALRALLRCDHDGWTCGRCGADLEGLAVIRAALDGMYRDQLHALERLVWAGGTAEGAARVLRDVARARELPSAGLPLPRPTRAERQQSLWVQEVTG